MCPCILLVLDLCKAEFFVQILGFGSGFIFRCKNNSGKHSSSDTSASVFCGSSLCVPEEYQKYIPERLVWGSGVWIIQRGLLWQKEIVLNVLMTNSSLPTVFLHVGRISPWILSATSAQTEPKNLVGKIHDLWNVNLLQVSDAFFEHVISGETQCPLLGKLCSSAFSRQN